MSYETIKNGKSFYNDENVFKLNFISNSKSRHDPLTR